MALTSVFNRLLVAPKFWYRPRRGVLAGLLAPLGGLYGLIGCARLRFGRSFQPQSPVVCVGNFTAGGAGKTPCALAIASLLRKAGCEPVFLTRGYGGRITGPHIVDPGTDSAADIGDEALLLTRGGMVVVAKDRAAGAQLIDRLGHRVIVMDDGFQNPSLRKTCSLLVVDGQTGIGNGLPLPAGPLRMPLSCQIPRTDAIIRLGATGIWREQLVDAIVENGLDMIDGRIEPYGDLDWFRGRTLIAYAGIGRPQKFFATLERLGATIKVKLPFADHRPYQPQDARLLLKLGRDMDLPLVTTEKDWHRLPDTGVAGELKTASKVLKVRAALDEQALMPVVAPVIAQCATE